MGHSRSGCSATSALKLDDLTLQEIFFFVEINKDISWKSIHQLIHPVSQFVSQPSKVKGPSHRERPNVYESKVSTTGSVMPSFDALLYHVDGYRVKIVDGCIVLMQVPPTWVKELWGFKDWTFFSVIKQQMLSLWFQYAPILFELEITLYLTHLKVALSLSNLFMVSYRLTLPVIVWLWEYHKREKQSLTSACSAPWLVSLAEEKITTPKRLHLTVWIDGAAS